MNRALAGLLVVVLTLLSGFMDARGFVYAARAWPEGRLDGRLALASMVAFFAGLSLYIVSVRFMQSFGLHAVALQAALWFVVTAIGVAAMDGSVLNWTRAQQFVAVGIIAGLGWLIATTSTSH
ncbi:MAG: hypothetical protein ACRETT_08940 [Steroidobacteraceae bacterium]